MADRYRIEPDEEDDDLIGCYFEVARQWSASQIAEFFRSRLQTDEAAYLSLLRKKLLAVNCFTVDGQPVTTPDEYVDKIMDVDIRLLVLLNEKLGDALAHNSQLGKASGRLLLNGIALAAMKKPTTAATTTTTTE